MTDTMNRPFWRAVEAVLKLEGGYVDHPDDKGGPTNFGISLRFLRTIDPNADGCYIRTMTEQRAKALYQVHFWEPLHCDDMPANVALCVFDCAVNQGPGTAAKLIQRAVGVLDDGIIGPVTLGVINDGSSLEIIRDFMARRAKRYAATANVETFGRGWFRRLFDVYDEAFVRRAGEAE